MGPRFVQLGDYIGDRAAHAGDFAQATLMNDLGEWQGQSRQIFGGAAVRLPRLRHREQPRATVFVGGCVHQSEALSGESSELFGTICRSKCRVPANGVVPVLDAREVLPSGRLIEIGHADDRRHQRDVGERNLTAEQPRSQ